MGPRAGLDGRKISSPPEFDPGPSSPQSVAIPTELPDPPFYRIAFLIYLMHTSKSVGEINRFESKMSLGNACCSEEQDALIGHKI